MTLALRYAIRSDVGLLREGNEDSAYAGPHLLAIADGMGGHAAGEVASSVAISALTGLDNEVPEDHLLGALAAAVATASSTLHEMSVEDPSLEGMGTTLTALLWSGTTIAICHIGDSRAYLLRDGDFRQITRDHTLVQSLVDDGRLSPAQAATHPQRSLVMRALQSGTEAEPDLSTIEATAGRQVPAVLGRAVRRGQRGDPARDADRGAPTADQAVGAAHRARDPRRRPGQHHLHRRRRGGRRREPAGRAGLRGRAARHRTATAGPGRAPTARPGAPTC